MAGPEIPGEPAHLAPALQPREDLRRSRGATAGMDRYDTASQRPPEDVRIAPFGHLSSQGFAGRELSDRLRQVAVRTAAAADELPDPRQQVVEIEPVEVSQHPGGRGRELQDADRSSRAEDAADLVQPLLQAPKVAQAEADEDVFE